MSGVGNPSAWKRSSTEEDTFPTSPQELDCPFEAPSLPDGAGLKPHLDSIFADVQSSLPTIDFDLSDASSDEDVQVLTRSVSRRKAPRAKQRPALTPESWKKALSGRDPDIANEVAYEFQEFPQSDKRADVKDSGLSSSGSCERDRYGEQDSPTVGGVTEHSGEGQDYGNGSHHFTSSMDSISSESDDDTLEVIEEIVGFKNIPLRLNFSENVVRSPDLVIDKNANFSSPPKPNAEVTEPATIGLEGHRSLPQADGSTGGAGFESFIPSNVPCLEMGPIDHIDLDLLLDAFPERGSPSGPGPQRTIPRHGAGDVEKTKDVESLKLMNQLAQLCVDQSGGSIKAEDLDRAPHPSGKRSKQYPSSLSSRSSMNERSQTGEAHQESSDLTVDLSSPQDGRPSPLSRPDSTQSTPSAGETGVRETIYLDLRAKPEEPDDKVGNPDAIRRILHLQSPIDSSSSSDEESDSDDPRAAWHAHRRRAMEKAGQVKGQPMNNKPRTSKRHAGARRDHHPATSPRVIPLQNDKKLPPAVHESDTKAISEPSSVLGHATPPQSPATGTPKERESAPSRDQERQDRAEVMRRLREQREAERQSRLRLQAQLSAMRPTTSGKSLAPRGTPIIFDTDSSYTMAPESLPPALQSEDEVLLLTARLSESGEIQSSRGSDGPQATSATYHVLLSFLLSLVPANLHFVRDKTLESKSSGKYLDSIPFRVVGIQQVFQEDRLMVHVAVVPKIAETSPFSKTRSWKPKGDRLGLTPFQRIMSRFLATNTLPGLCPWLNDLSYPVQTSGGDLVHTPLGCGYESCHENGTYIPSVPHPTAQPLDTFLSINQDPRAARRMFALPLSFFWATIPSEEKVFPDIPSELGDQIIDVQTTMSLIFGGVFRTPMSMIGVLRRISQEGLEIAGLRVLYQKEELLNNPGGIHPQIPDSKVTRFDLVHPVLSLALRGNEARKVWLDTLGPSDPVLAQRTDPMSIMANYGGVSREDSTIYSPRNPNRTNYDLSYWFGGRVPVDGVVDLGSLQRGIKWGQEVEAKGSTGGSESARRKKKRGSRKEASTIDPDREDFQIVRTHISTLVATTPADVFLTVSPLVPPICLGLILSVCIRRGFLLCGIKRMRLNSKRANTLGLSGVQVRVFSPLSCTTPTSPKNYEEEIRSSIESGLPSTTRPPMPSTIILLRKEGATHHATSLQEALMTALGKKGILTRIKEEAGLDLPRALCFHVTPYSDSLLTALGGDFNGVPSYERFASAPSSFYSSPELEQIVVIAFTGPESLKKVGESLGGLLGIRLVNPTTNNTSNPGRGLEVLGLKLLPSLSLSQAKEITPYEVGSRDWRGSTQDLSSRPALLCILRGVNAFMRVQQTLGITTASQEDRLRVIMSASPEVAYRQAAHFFRDHELFADPLSRENLCYLPPLRSPSLEELSTARFSWAEDKPKSPSSSGKKAKRGAGPQHNEGTMIVEESIFKTMLAGPRMLTTLMLIKPFAVQRYLSKVMKRVLQEDFTIVAMRMVMLSPIQAAILVPDEARSNEIVSSMHVTHLVSGPCLALCLFRENAVKKLLDLLGPQNPAEAKQTNQFLWRGLYGSDVVNNALHGSESYTSAVEEIKALFPDGICHAETPDLLADRIAAPSVDRTLGTAQALRRRFRVTSRESIRGQSSSTSVSSTSGISSLKSPRSSSTTSMGVSASLSDLSLLSYSALCETNCLLLTPLLQLLDIGIHRKGYVEVIDSLLGHGFEIVGLRMIWFTWSQAEEYLAIYHNSNQNLNKLLCHGPCIALAVQRDNAVNCFETSLGSTLEKDSIIAKYGNQILRPKDVAGAKEHLAFFFDELMPHSQGYIAENEG